jgi:cellulose synthase/poly-beta-1,6-N-acetylglucosamine synthase-like glycosyltransferase
MEYVFAGALGFVLYVLFGYPLLLALRARLRRRPVTKRFEPRTVSVLLPVYNGEAWIGQKLENLLALDYPAGLMDIVVVSDGSTDGTERIARTVTARHIDVKLLSIPKRGKASPTCDRRSTEGPCAVWWRALQIPVSAPPAAS